VSRRDPNELLTVEEVAKILRLNQQTVRNMIDRRELGSIRVGPRRVRVRRSQLDEFLAAGERPARAVLREAEHESSPWQAFRAALEAVIHAANDENQDALNLAMSELTVAMRAPDEKPTYSG